jgi:hypothetical protein
LHLSSLRKLVATVFVSITYCDGYGMAIICVSLRFATVERWEDHGKFFPEVAIGGGSQICETFCNTEWIATAWQIIPVLKEQ